MLPTQDAMKVAADKQSSQILAEKLGIPTPTTKVVHTLEDLENASQLFGHPFIIKDVFGSGKNQVISRHEDIYACGKTLMQGSSGTLIAQEFVIGDGYGFFCSYETCKLRAYFMHKRLREGLPYGGPSTCARSWFDEKLAEYGIRILEALDWNGVAMVEFRKSKSGEFKLLEINPKFWGSLDLALASGVDFPKLVVNCIVDGDCETVLKYNLNMTYQWPVPDDILRMKWNLSNLRTSVNDIFDPSIKKNILMSDPGPLLISAIRLAKELILGS
ncbi:MAG: ATP-grasp domain-containing protein [Thaumarchaeota archaeon]|nr:ATP-grasp domain-containing protein [Nitrososphaerota archaeon]